MRSIRFLCLTTASLVISSSLAVAECVSDCMEAHKKCAKATGACEADKNECLKKCSPSGAQKTPPSNIVSCSPSAGKIERHSVTDYECVVVNNDCDYGVKFDYILNGNKLPTVCVPPNKTNYITSNCSGDKKQATLTVLQTFAKCK